MPDEIADSCVKTPWRLCCFRASGTCYVFDIDLIWRFKHERILIIKVVFSF